MVKMIETKEEFEKVLIDARQKGIEAVIGLTDTYPCGGAYLKADGNSNIVKLFKKYGTKVGDSYEIMGWHASKGYPSGYDISHGGNHYQNMDMHSRRATAECGELGMNNLVVRVETYID